MSGYAAELAFARECALVGGAIARERYRRAPAARRKADGTWVSEADEAVEAELRARIARAYPDHSIHGEEQGLTRADGGPPEPGAPCWVIDPIDGTNNYLAGIPVWGTLVALEVGGDGVVGIAHLPLLDETYDAAAGSGARCNGVAIATERLEALADATVLVGAVGAFWELSAGEFHRALVASARRDRGLGDCWGHLLVARGAAHLMCEPYPLPIWDVAALRVIVREAGGRLTQPDGSPWQPGAPVLTTGGGALHDEVSALWRALT